MMIAGVEISGESSPEVVPREFYFVKVRSEIGLIVFDVLRIFEWPYFACETSSCRQVTCQCHCQWSHPVQMYRSTDGRSRG